MGSKPRSGPLAWAKVGRLLAILTVATLGVALVAAGGTTAALGNERYSPIIMGPSSPSRGQVAVGGTTSSQDPPPLGTPGTPPSEGEYGNMSVEDGAVWALGPGNRVWHRFEFTLPYPRETILDINVTWGGEAPTTKALLLWNFTSSAWAPHTSAAPGRQLVAFDIHGAPPTFIGPTGLLSFMVITPPGANATLATDFVGITIGRPGAFYNNLGTALLLGGMLYVVGAMVMALASAPPRILAWVPRGRGPTGMPKKDPLEATREQFIMTILIFLLGLAWMGLSFLVALA